MNKFLIAACVIVLAVVFVGAGFFVYKSFDINARDAEGATSLIRDLRFMSSTVDKIKLLLDKGADVNAKDNYGNTPLTTACDQGQIEIVELLIDRGASINAQTASGDTALMLACSSGNQKIVKLLIDKGADVNIKDSRGDSALSNACVGGFYNTAQILINNKADVNAKNSDGETILKMLQRIINNPVEQCVMIPFENRSAYFYIARTDVRSLDSKPRDYLGSEVAYLGLVHEGGRKYIVGLLKSAGAKWN